MTEAETSIDPSFVQLPEEQLREEARLLYKDFLTALLSNDMFRNLFVAQKKASKFSSTLRFDLNGKHYNVEIGDWPYVFKIGEYQDHETPIPDKRLLIQIPIHGYPNTSAITFFQPEVHSDSLLTFSPTRNNRAAISKARELLRNLSNLS